MATVNLGQIKPVFKGAYNNSTAYVLDNIVTSGGSSYICILASTGNAVSNATYWSTLAAGTGDASDLTSGTLPIARIADDAITLAKMAPGTDGNIISYDASGNPVAIATGSDGQVLTSTGAGSPPAFEAAAGGAFAQFVHNSSGTQYSNTSTSAYVRATNVNVVITPTSASNDIHIKGSIDFRTTVWDSSFTYKIIRSIAGGSETTLYTSSTMFGYAYPGTTTGQSYTMQQIEFLDTSHNTTSAITYVIEFKNSHRTDVIYVNYSAPCTSYMNAYEIN